jgi:Universal stress protein family
VAGVPCEGVHVVSDDPYQAINERAQSKGCDLIFMASHGRKGVSALLLAETTKVLTMARSRCSFTARATVCAHPTGTRGRALLRGIVLVGYVLGPSLASAQENFEIQVYGSETVAPGTTMVELHSNVAARGTTRAENGVVRSQGAFHETLEITQGWTSWFETGFYVFTSIQPDSGWEWVGDHIRPRIRAPESWQLPVGLSLSTEIGYQRRSFSTDTGP